MNRLRPLLSRKSLGRKLFIYFLLAISIPIVIVTMLGNLIYNKSITNQQDENSKQMTKQITNNIDFYIKDTENVISYLSQDPRVLKFLKTKDTNEADYSAINESTEKTITSFSGIHPEMAGVMIVNSNDLFSSDIMDRISRDPLTNEKWYAQAVENPNTMQLFSKPVGRNISNIFQYSADDVVSMSKAIIDKSSGKCIGVILIDLKLDIIKSIIEDVKPGKTGFVYIVDSNDEIVYAPVNPIVYRIKNEWISNTNNNIINKRISGTNFEVLHNDSAYTKWRTVSILPLDESLKTTNAIKYYSFIVAIITLIIAEIFAIFFISSIVRPITKLKMLMKKTEEGNFDVYFNSKEDDEIGELGSAFNNMVHEIKNLIELVKIEGKKKRKAEISILQAQIKPHFIYNTLDTIQWMAQEHDAEDIVDMVGNLTNLLRIGLSAGAEIITIKQELAHVESYLIIQKVRYEDKLNYTIEIEEKILTNNVVKLILQPIVENAIYHGIKEKRGKGLITIRGEEKDKKIHFIIEDNGIGIKPDTLKDINAMLRGEAVSSEVVGYGIYNVNEKIRLTYGEEYGLQYHSTYGAGTTVEIWHPVI